MSILDYKLQHDLRRYIRKLPREQQDQMKSVRLCNQSVRSDMQHVYLMASDKGSAMFHGTNTCKNPFCCPVCSAKMMEKYRAKIASAIECLHDEYFGVMVTFSIPHWKFMTCREQMDILYDTWSYFRCKKFSRGHGHVYDEFNKVCPVHHHVKVCEHTHGNNGWHAHFHCIFWFKRGDEQIILRDGWEEKLNAFWLHVAKSKTLAYWKKHDLHKELIENGDVDRLMEYFLSITKENQSVHFSKDANGNLREVKTADYISGWGEDKEVTGNRRKQASHSAHRTPYQILEDAAHDKQSENLYIEFCLAVTRKPVHHRVDFSQTGLSKMIEEWRKEHPINSSVLQKKSQEETPAKWSIVCYFEKYQWYDLLDRERESPILSNILFLAAKHIYLLGDFLDNLGIRYEVGNCAEIRHVEMAFCG